MNFKNLILIFVLLYAMKSMAGTNCKIESYNKVFYCDKSKVELTDVIKNSDCSTKEQLQFIKSLLSYDGNVPYYQLKEDLSQGVTISPSMIQVQSFNDLLKSKLGFSAAHQFTNIKGHTFSAIGITPEQTITASLQNRNLGQKHISFEILNSMTGKKVKHWISSVLKVQTKALVSNSFQSFNNSGVSKQMFDIKNVYSEHPERLFKDFSKLEFYRLGRPLSQGQLVKKTDFSPLLLVRAGVPSSITYKQNGINLTSKATPVTSGKFGDFIRLKTKNNKVITGKVSDFNKVVIQL